MEVHQFIVRETVISILINCVISILFFMLVFGSRNPVPVWGVGNWVFDFVPQGFMIGLMSTLVPGLLAAKALKAGKVRQKNCSPRQSLPLPIRAILTALVAAAFSYALFAVAMHVSDVESLAVGTALAIKAVFGGLLAAFITPIVLMATLQRTST